MKDRGAVRQGVMERKMDTFFYLQQLERLKGITKKGKKGPLMEYNNFETEQSNTTNGRGKYKWKISIREKKIKGTADMRDRGGLKQGKVESKIDIEWNTRFWRQMVILPIEEEKCQYRQKTSIWEKKIRESIQNK